MSGAIPIPSAGQTFTLMLDGWLVWDGLYGPLHLGDVFAASVEFAPLSVPVQVDLGSERSLRHLDANRYAAVGVVRESSETQVLDVGELRVLRWARPGDALGALTAGATVALEAALNLNPWAEADWSRHATSEQGAMYQWRVERMTRYRVGEGDPTDVRECSTDTVDSADQYCLLECTLLGAA